MKPEDRIVTFELKGKVFIPCKYAHIVREILEENKLKICNKKVKRGRIKC